VSEIGPPVVAVLNSSDDTVELLRMALENAGLATVSLHLDEIRRQGIDLIDFVKQHDPKVVLYDLAPPYDRSWLFLQHLRNTGALKGRPFVLTSTNPARVKQIAHVEEPILEVIGKPYDIDEIVSAVQAKLHG
jgi:CheY-like chemotaxis protein